MGTVSQISLVTFLLEAENKSQIPVITFEFPEGAGISDENANIDMPLAWGFVLIWLGFYPANGSSLICGVCEPVWLQHKTEY